ncbi:MAG: hypothetical protein QF605_08680, partial [Rhodospirillales bacterium]|nr:hypothetical protein [Rhodospirillales bacterium]
TLGESVKRAGHMCDEVGSEVELGIHLCYGDPGHKHIVEPSDLGTFVAFANGIIDTASRKINFMHMAVPKDRNDEAYFAPLNRLSMLAETRLILGLVHHTGTTSPLIDPILYIINALHPNYYHIPYQPPVAPQDEPLFP